MQNRFSINIIEKKYFFLQVNDLYTYLGLTTDKYLVKYVQ